MIKEHSIAGELICYIYGAKDIEIKLLKKESVRKAKN